MSGEEMIIEPFPSVRPILTDLQLYIYACAKGECSLTHSAHTPPAVHPGITIWVDEIELELNSTKINFLGREIFFWGGGQFLMNFLLFLTTKLKFRKNNFLTNLFGRGAI